MKNNKAEETAKNTLRKMSLKNLVEQFELTATITDKNIYIVRGWLMDIIQEKAPEGFDKWLESENAADEELKNYVLA